MGGGVEAVTLSCYPGTMAGDEQRERWGSQQGKKKADFWE